MIEKFYTCTLQTDIILSSNLATANKFETLNFIPGNNFLGVVANEIYDKVSAQSAYDIFHSGKVRFGNGYISVNNRTFYPLPKNFLREKSNPSNKSVYIHGFVNPIEIVGETKVQLKALNSGFISNYGDLIQNVQSNFTIRSAYNKDTRSSKDGAMFGFQSLAKGQIFVFSIQYDDEGFVTMVENALIGDVQIGKSRSAEFGQVNIQPKNEIENSTYMDSENFTLVYFESDAVFQSLAMNEKLTTADLGLKEGHIDWGKSQIRYSDYCNWNAKRSTHNARRKCVSKGSVIYVDGASAKGRSEVGEYQAEGLGRLIYNPIFLSSDASGKARLDFIATSSKVEHYSEKSSPISSLIGILEKRKAKQEIEIAIVNYINTKLNHDSPEIKALKRVSSSQWGSVRKIASQCKNVDEIMVKLFDSEMGYLKHGVSYQKYWGAKEEYAIDSLKSIIKDFNYAEKADEYMPLLLEKFCAEISKTTNRNKTR